MKTYPKIAVFIFVVFSVVACGKWGKKEKEIEQAYTPFTITTNDLPTLKYEAFHTTKRVMTFAPDEIVSYYPMPHTEDTRHIIIRSKSPNAETRYYYGEENDTDIKLCEISPVVHLADGEKQNRIFSISLSETGEYYTSISAVVSRPGEFSRGPLNYGIFSLGFVKRDYYSDELNPYYSYTDYCEQGKPPVVFSSKNLEKENYIELDELWDSFRLQYYENDTSAVAFHVLPPYYKNHDMMVERTKTADGENRYLLRRINLRWDGQVQQRRIASLTRSYETILNLTPQRIDPLTNEKIVSEFEVLKRNIVLAFEERSRGAYKHKYLYSVSPYTHEPGDLSSDDQIAYTYYSSNNTWLSGPLNDRWFRDMKEAAATKDYLKWLCKNHDELYAVDMILHPNDTGRKHYEVYMKARDHIVEMMRKSGLVSEKYEQHWIDYFDKADEYHKKNPEDDGPPTYFDYDIFLNTQESDALNTIHDNRMSVTMVRRIAHDRSVVSVNMGYHDMTFELSCHNGKWLIDGTLNDVSYLATDEPLAIFMTDDDEQIMRMLKHYNMEQEDRLYYDLIRHSIPGFRRNGVNVDILDPKRYSTIRFADGTTFDTVNDFYYYDVMLYKPGQAPTIIRNIARDESWKEIRTYFGVDDI